MIYVISPTYFKTGGTELLHQLVYALNKNNLSAKIVYPDATSDKNINPAFLEYVDEYVIISEVNDNENNFIVIPETMTYFARYFKKSKIAIWWESVDNYFNCSSILYNLKNKNLSALKATLINKFLNRKNKQLSYRELKKVDYHFAQSHYAMNFAKRHKFKNICYLSDYINDNYIANKCNIDLNKKENIVCYNPKKGIKFTKKIIKTAKNIKFVPIINMTNEEVIELLTRAKVYIDFGNHPGKDRFPREAAISYCAVITNKKGSAKYYGDVRIFDKYKFKDRVKNIHNIIECINDCFQNYNTIINEFEEYRDTIENEKKYFMLSIKEIFEDKINDKTL